MHDQHTPFLSNRFSVEIDGEQIGVSRVILPGATSATVSYAAGNDRSLSPRQLVGKTENDLLVLERGVTETKRLYDWYVEARRGDLEGARRDITVAILTEEFERAAVWKFPDAWPAHYQPPVLDAHVNEVAIERFEIAHEGMYRE